MCIRDRFDIWCLKFDVVITKIILLVFFETRCSLPYGTSHKCITALGGNTLVTSVLPLVIHLSQVYYHLMLRALVGEPNAYPQINLKVKNH